VAEDEMQGKGGNGEARPDGEEPRPPEPEVVVSPKVKKLVDTYGDGLVTVNLRTGIWLMDCIDARYLGTDAGGQDRIAFFFGQAKFQVPDSDETTSRVTDLLEEVVIQASECGERVALLKCNPSELGQSGAIMAYIVDPEEILCVIKPFKPPPREWILEVVEQKQRQQGSAGRRIHMPGD
jgi:hypothetical protein